MEIVKYGHPVLRWKSSPLTSISPDFKATVSQMFELMYEANGIGLAANQVGLPYRFFLVNCTADPKEKDEEMVFINPVIKRRKGSVEGEEGCLSLPELYGEVPRAEEIVVEAFDLTGEGFEMEASDLLARVILHENDHLDGVLFIDRLKPNDLAELQPNLNDFEQEFRDRQKSGDYPTDDAIKAKLAEMVKTFEFPEA